MSEKAWWTTANDLAAVLEVNNPDTAAQAVMTRLAEGIRGAIIEECGRQILAPETGTLVEYHDGGREKITPKVSPVASVANVWVDSLRAFGSATLVASTFYQLSDNSIFFLIAPIKGRGVVKVEYVGGYPTLPKDIERVFHHELRKEWALKSSAGIQSFGVSGSNWTVQQRFGLSDETRRVLRPHKASCPFF